MLALWIVYPTVWTVVRSLFDRGGRAFVGLANYREVFSDDTLLTAVRNNAIWLGVVPALVTALGLILAVLTERVSWRVAIRLAIFMPMAISLFAAGVIWRLALDIDPERGAVNAAIGAVRDAAAPPGSLAGALPSTLALRAEGGGLALVAPLAPGRTAALGLTGIRPQAVPEGARQARAPHPLPGGIAGVVWRDFRPGGGRPGTLERGELGLPGTRVELRGPGGVRSAIAGPDGRFAFADLAPGSYRVGLAPSQFRGPFEGVSWLGATLITTSVIVAYIWVWAGFALVVIAAGLAALPRDLLEAARVDGASEWQVLRRVTVPLLAPVLSVVFVTMTINVLKVFDIVLTVAPDSVQDDASVLALAMWRRAFIGAGDYGVGSAIAVLLLLLVIPVLILNVRRLRER